MKVNAQIHTITITFLVEQQLDTRTRKLVENKIDAVFESRRNEEGTGIIFYADIPVRDNGLNAFIGKDIEFMKNEIDFCINKTISAISLINKTVDESCQILVGPGANIGYSSYAKEFLDVPLCEIDDDTISIFMEWEAVDKNDATEKQKELQKNVSKVLGTKLDFRVENNIWGLDEDLWYVVANQEIDIQDINGSILETATTQ